MRRTVLGAGGSGSINSDFVHLLHILIEQAGAFVKLQTLGYLV